MPCDQRCWTAKSDPSKCKCECCGRNHGRLTQGEQEDPILRTIILTDKEAYPFRMQFDRRNQCSCGHYGMHSQPIKGYKPHPGGWIIRGELYWLYVTCPHCGYDWSVWKLGAEREEREIKTKQTTLIEGG